MPPAPAAMLDPLVKKLQLWGTLNEEEQQAILDLPHKVEEVLPHKYLVRE